MDNLVPGENLEQLDNQDLRDRLEIEDRRGNLDNQDHKDLLVPRDREATRDRRDKQEFLDKQAPQAFLAHRAQ
jgi:hypothetical protein